jgi:TonB family protein
MKTAINFANFCGRVGLVLCLFAVLGVPAFAYDDPPMRVARLNFVQGSVSFQPAGESDWAWATVNRPMTAGDSLWTGNNSKAEMHIGSTAIRVGGLTSVSFLNLDDRTVQIQLNSGTINLRVRNLYRDDVLEVDTPNLAFTVLRQGDYRITVDPNGGFTTITLRDGQGQVTGGGQAFLVDGRSQVQVSGTDYISYDIYDLPGRDSFDQWAYTRQLREERSRSARYVSPELTGSEDLDRNGTWRTDRNFGPVWVPTHVSRDWAPYKQGHWAWVEPWGWTWVDDSPSGFVTSHYGRWAHVDGGYGGGGWVWVPPHREANHDVYAQRPVYSPALVTFVGDSNSSRDFGNSGGVAWVPLAPGEVYVPSRQTSPTYVTNINVTNTVVQQTTITNVVNNNVQNNTYVNQKVVGAVTAVPRATFVNAQPVAHAAVRVAPSAITVAPAVHTAPVAPVRASVMGANKATSPATASAAAVSAPPKPPEALVTRAIVTKVAPPPPPVAFAQKQQALQANPGKPLDAKAEQNLRAAAPPPVVRIVKTAPPPAVVKPVETVAKKPQPATSLNTAQQAHPPAPGAPPAAAAAQSPQQQQAAEKAKQQAAQQQASQQAAAAEKSKQEAAQQQATQQAAAEKVKQEAAQKAKLDAARPQAATDKAKQDAAQQQASAEKSKQQSAQLAATEKTKQEAAQQQAAQQAAGEKSRQEAAQQQQAAQQVAAEKAKQQAAQQQLATEKTKQEAAQQQAAQQAAAEKAKQDNVRQQAAQQATAEKAKQEAAQQHAAQLQAVAEKTKQDAAQQQATQQAAVQKAKLEAAQQQAADRARQQPPREERPPSNPNARPPSASPSANQPPVANSGPVRVAENVQAAKLVSQPKLNYPPQAKAAHIAGTVRIQALIGADGGVKTATVLSGPEPLHAAALENARQRRYQPTLLNGKPVEVETEISIPF